MRVCDSLAPCASALTTQGILNVVDHLLRLNVVDHLLNCILPAASIPADLKNPRPRLSLIYLSIQTLNT